MKIRIHPLVYLLAIYFALIGRGMLLGGYLFAVVMHEVAHARMAKWRGYRLGKVTIMPYGGVIEGGSVYHTADNIWIALAGPAINLIIAVILTAMWWLMPASYTYTLDFCIANVAIAAVNLLPAYPLDGSRIVYALARNKLRALRALRIVGILLGSAMLVLCVVSLWYEFHLSIGLFGLFLVWGAWSGSEQQTFLHLSARTPLVKDYACGVRSCELTVDYDTPVLRLISRLNPQECYRFCIRRQDGADVTLSESDLTDLCAHCELTDAIGPAWEQFAPQIARARAQKT